MQTNPAAAARLIAEALAAHGGEATEQSEVDSPEHADKGDATGLNPAGTEAHPSAKDPTQDAAATDAGMSAAETASGIDGSDPKEAGAPPAKRTKVDVRQSIEVSLRNLNPYIVCQLCAGYFINATTIMECLHTFCKSCIVRHFANHESCPTCGVTISGTNHMEMLRPDRTMQSIVYKLVTGLQEEEERRYREFQIKSGLLPEPGTDTSADAAPAAPDPKKKPKKEESDDQISFVLELEKKSEEPQVDDPVDDAGEAKVKRLDKPYIRTSSKATIMHLKKFLAKKLHLNRTEDVDILCKGEVLGKECTLQFIARTRWRKHEQLVLTYRPKVDFQA